MPEPERAPTTSVKPTGFTKNRCQLTVIPTAKDVADAKSYVAIHSLQSLKNYKINRKVSKDSRKLTLTNTGVSYPEQGAS